MARGNDSSDRGSEDPPRLRRVPPPSILRSIGFSLKSDIWKNKQRLWTLFIISALLISFLAGIVYYWNQRDIVPEEDHIEIYMTDLPANFTRVDVVLSGVYVGAANHSLTMEKPAFDLLALRGPEGALRVASGNVPRDNHSEVRIVFESVHVSLNGASIALELPDPVLFIGHPLGLGAHDGSAFLFDVNLDESIVATDKGLAFRPTVDALYIHHYGGAGSSVIPGSSGGEFRPIFDLPVAPDKEILEKEKPKLAPSGNPFNSITRGPTTSTSSRFTWNPPTTGSTTTSRPASTAVDPTVPQTTETSNVLPSPGDINSIPEDPGEPGGWFVRFIPDEEDQAVLVAMVESTGATVIFMFGSENAAYIFATPDQAQALSEVAGVLYVEADQAVVLNMQSSTQAIRLPELQNPLLGQRDAQGNTLDGRDIGVAIIDLGFDGTHPDLRHRVLSEDPALLVNYKVESLFSIDIANTDQTSGHGTHVAAILAGRGISDPTQRGIAYGSGIYGFAIGEMSTTLWPNVALDWLVQNHDLVDPPIRVVSNSWGSGSSYDPESLTTKLIERLVDEGVVVVFSAGNGGGDGSIRATTSQCQIPKEGVICVAAFDDFNMGARDGDIASYSSRGKLSDTHSWPDISAPGSNIRSARPLFGQTTGFGFVPYETLSGTSMAAPHVAGAAVVMLQANPGLLPADVERIIESTAYKYLDGGSYTASADYRFDGSHYAKGHGLLDIFAAVDEAKSS